MFVSATPPSSPPVSSPSLGVVPLVHPRHRVQTRQAAQGDHPALLQPLEVWVVLIYSLKNAGNAPGRYYYVLIIMNEAHGAEELLLSPH